MSNGYYIYLSITNQVAKYQFKKNNMALFKLIFHTNYGFVVGVLVYFPFNASCVNKCFTSRKE